MAGIHRLYIPNILWRSRQAPLNLGLHFDSPNRLEKGDSHLNYWLSPIILKRARTLDIAASPDIVTLVADRLPPQMQDVIRLCVVRRGGWRPQDGQPLLPEPLKDLPGVTRLTLQNWVIPWRSPILSSKLTHLCLSSTGALQHLHRYGDIAELLSLPQGLEVLEMRDIAPRFGLTGGQSPVISLPSSLRYLKVTFADGSVAADGLTYISLLDTPPRCTRHHEVSGFRTFRQFPEIARIDDALGRLMPALSLAAHDGVKMQHAQLTNAGLRLVSDVLK